MKKLGVLVFILLLLVIAVSAANETFQDKAYSCLENKVKDCSSLTLEQQAFSLLALASNSKIQSDCKSSIKNSGKDNECWPSSSCKIKDTALAILALKNSGEDTKKAEAWILSNNKTPTGIEFYLEIDASSETQCKISYDSFSKKVTIGEDKKLSIETSDCFSLDYDNYWLRIKEHCIKKKFTISCDKDFISTILYKKANSNVWQVSSDTKSASASGTTEHEINTYCFSTSLSCNYEDNLWAALALQKDNDIKDLLPYLIILSDDNDNKKLFPSAFLHLFDSSGDYLTEILSLQKTSGEWDLKEKGKFYDTALALMALQESEAENNAKNFLKSVQGADGCWNNGNIRDTAILLWFGWPRVSAISLAPSSTTTCQDVHGYCISQGECDEAEGSKISSVYCSGTSVCCDKPRKEKTCKEEGGVECESDEECDVNEIPTSDTDKCCKGSCVPKTNECQEANYFCRTSCLESEEELALSCSSNEKCCNQKPETKSYWWIWLLSILIILVIIGIIFRNKLRLFLFKFRGGISSQAVPKTRPGFPPSQIFQPGFQQPGMRRIIPTSATRQMRQPIRPTTKSKTDAELEETLKKLKEMSK